MSLASFVHSLLVEPQGHLPKDSMRLLSSSLCSCHQLTLPLGSVLSRGLASEWDVFALSVPKTMIISLIASNPSRMVLVTLLCIVAAKYHCLMVLISSPASPSGLDGFL